MSIFDSPPTPTVDAPNAAAVRAAKIIDRAYKQAEAACKRIKKLYDAQGRAAMDAEFSGEAADAVAKYDIIKTMANNHPDCNAEDLPT
jgi:hypothetical protein